MAIAGKNGKVIIGTGTTKVVGIKNWSLELSLETLETTALGDDWKNYISGLKEWTASAEGDFEVTTDTTGQKLLSDAYLAGTTVEVKLFVDATNYYTDTAPFSSWPQPPSISPTASPTMNASPSIWTSCRLFSA